MEWRNERLQARMDLLEQRMQVDTQVPVDHDPTWDQPPNLTILRMSAPFLVNFDEMQKTTTSWLSSHFA
eukprot:3657044-Karenia_brevis.AAC.1